MSAHQGTPEAAQSVTLLKIQRFTEWLVTLSLAERYSARLDALFKSFNSQQSTSLALLQEFDERYKFELSLGLKCAGAALWMGLDCPKLYAGPPAESLAHPIPRILWALSIFYAICSIAPYLSITNGLHLALASEHSARLWIENARRLRQSNDRKLTYMLSLPPLWSAWALIFFGLHKSSVPLHVSLEPPPYVVLDTPTVVAVMLCFISSAYAVHYVKNFAILCGRA